MNIVHKILKQNTCRNYVKKTYRCLTQKIKFLFSISQTLLWNIYIRKIPGHYLSLLNWVELISKWIIIPILFRLFICVFHSTSYKRNIPLYKFLLVYYFQYNTLLTHRYRKRKKIKKEEEKNQRKSASNGEHYQK